MSELLEALRMMHMVAGFAGLAAWWVPVLTRKGGKTHRLFGKIFKYCAYLVLYGALVSVVLHGLNAVIRSGDASLDPAEFSFLIFLGYLALVTLIGLHHGFAVLRNKQDLRQMNTLLNRTAAWLSITASVLLVTFALVVKPREMILLLALSPIGIATGLGILKAIRGRRPEGKAWFYEHMGAMMGTGIAFHTAFAVFGSRAVFDLGLTGWVAVIPWILPALIGIPAINLWTLSYRRKFGDSPA